MNAKMCTEAEGYKLIAIVISTQLLPTLNLSCSKGKSGIPLLMVNFLAFITVSKHYHPVITGFHEK